MDDLGNRAGNQTLRDDGTVNFAVDTETNRYTSVGGNTLTYDNAGNLTTDKDGYVYTYDYENRITKIVDDQQNLIAEFDYDTQGRRIRVYDAVAGTTTLYYYSDSWQVLSEYDNSNNLQAYYIFGNYIDEVLLMHRSSADKFYLHDHLYSPVALLDSSGAVQERYEYDAYGKATVWDSTFTNSDSASQYGNPYLFTGREVNQFDNGDLTLQYNRNRYLSQYMGCWITPDQADYVNGLNYYQYAKSQTISYVDSFGLLYEDINPGGSLRPGLYGYNLGVEEPPLDETMWEAVLSSASAYGKSMGSIDPWYAQETYDKIETLISKMGLLGASNAKKLYKVYFNNMQPSGGEVGGKDVGEYMHIEPIDYAAMIKNSITAKEEAMAAIKSVILFVNNNRGLTHGSSIVTKSDVAANPVGKFDSFDWFLAIHNYRTWHKAENIKCNNGTITADFTINLRDVFDWNPNVHEPPIKWLASLWEPANISQSDFYMMHRYRLMREFFVKGEASTTLRWRIGSTALIDFHGF